MPTAFIQGGSKDSCAGARAHTYVVEVGLAAGSSLGLVLDLKVNLYLKSVQKLHAP